MAGKRIWNQAACGVLLGAAIGLWMQSGVLKEALDRIAEEQWAAQGMWRLVALALEDPIGGIARIALLGLAMGALAGLRRGPFPGLPRLLRWAGATAATLILSAWGTASILTARSAAGAPDVLWIVVDTLRADRLGCYGYEKDTSPFLDDLASQSVRFKTPISQESYTIASVASYFTSIYPPEHAVLYNDPGLDVVDRRLLTVAEVLRNQGYATAAFVFNPHLQKKTQFDQGFDHYDDTYDNFTQDPGTARHAVAETAARLEKKVEAYLDEDQGDRPRFLYLHYLDVHAPYVPPPPYHEMFLPDDATQEDRALVAQWVGEPFDGGGPMPEWVRTRPDLYAAQYDGEIRYTDDMLRRLFNRLAERGITLDNTIVVVTSDHGEALRDQHPMFRRGDARTEGMIEFGHGRTVYIEQVHVPLIVSAPGMEGGLVVEAPVELMDIAPTLVDLLGIDAASLPFQGMSLVPPMEGTALHNRPVFSGGNHGRGMVMAAGFAYHNYDESAVKGGTYGSRPADDYISRREEEFFDMEGDPLQTTDLLVGGRRPAPSLKGALLEWLGRARNARAPQVIEDEKTREKLRALGYLGD